MFQQPGAAPAFLQQVLQQKVCLENAFAEGAAAVAGIVRVANLSFHKAVAVRWTTNDWATTTEQQATHVAGSSRDATDQFSFRLEVGGGLGAGGRLGAGARLQLAVKFTCLGEHWDSNRGANYTFQVGAGAGASKETDF